MRTIRYYAATTIDGFIAREDGRFDFFVHDEELVTDMFAYLKRDFDAVVMGRATYDVGLAAGVTNPYPWLKTYVLSNSIAASPDPNVTLLRDIDEIENLKRGEGGNIWLCGGGRLATAMHARGLIDELVLKTNPVVLGRGIPLFGPLTEPLRLSATAEGKRYPSGITVTPYRIGV